MHEALLQREMPSPQHPKYSTNPTIVQVNRKSSNTRHKGTYELIHSIKHVSAKFDFAILRDQL